MSAYFLKHHQILIDRFTYILIMIILPKALFRMRGGLLQLVILAITFPIPKIIGYQTRKTSGKLCTSKDQYHD